MIEDLGFAKDHTPKSKEIYDFIADLDFKEGNDFFCFKSGGDGDNGELLMDYLDAYFKSKQSQSKTERKSTMTWFEAMRKLEKANLTDDEKEALRVLDKEIHERPSKHDLEDLQWEFGVTLRNYCNRCEEPYENDELTDEYAKALIINAQIGYGLVFVIEDFIEDVRAGGFIDYDGQGEALDKDGNRMGYISCNVRDLQGWQKKGARYVAWFNK